MRTWHGDVDLIRFCSEWQVEMTHYERGVDLRTWAVAPENRGRDLVWSQSAAQAEICEFIEILCSVQYL